MCRLVTSLRRIKCGHLRPLSLHRQKDIYSGPCRYFRKQSHIGQSSQRGPQKQHEKQAELPNLGCLSPSQQLSCLLHLLPTSCTHCCRQCTAKNLSLLFMVCRYNLSHTINAAKKLHTMFPQAAVPLSYSSL